MNKNVFYKNIILKSCDINNYPDEVVRCRVIENKDIGAYLNLISNENKIVAKKVAPVMIRNGSVGERINTVLVTTRNNNKYILFEQSNVVRERDNSFKPDIVIKNFQSSSCEEYVVKPDNFLKAYSPNKDGTYSPVSGERELVLINEDIIIKTSWGTEAVCLSGSYIVVYDSKNNDYNVLEKGAMETTYKREKKHLRTRKY